MESRPSAVTGRDQRKRASRSTSPVSSRVSQTLAICAAEKHSPGRARGGQAEGGSSGDRDRARTGGPSAKWGRRIREAEKKSSGDLNTIWTTEWGQRRDEACLWNSLTRRLLKSDSLAHLGVREGRSLWLLIGHPSADAGLSWQRCQSNAEDLSPSWGGRGGWTHTEPQQALTPADAYLLLLFTQEITYFTWFIFN